VRLLGAALLPPGHEVALPVRLAEPATASIVVAGDRVDVLSRCPTARRRAVVASGVRVLACRREPSGDGALLVWRRPADARRATGRRRRHRSLSVLVLGR
jgi:Flp pilus assembly protein CpaB